MIRFFPRGLYCLEVRDEYLAPKDGSLTVFSLAGMIKKVGLLPAQGSTDSAAEAKFSLDASVGDEGTVAFLQLLFTHYINGDAFL